jgi:hypothetical protein
MTKYTSNVSLDPWSEFRDSVVLLAAGAVLLGLPPVVPILLTGVYGVALVRPALESLRRCWAAARRGLRLLARRARRPQDAPPERIP